MTPNRTNIFNKRADSIGAAGKNFFDSSPATGKHSAIATQILKGADTTIPGTAESMASGAGSRFQTMNIDHSVRSEAQEPLNLTTQARFA